MTVRGLFNVTTNPFDSAGTFSLSTTIIGYGCLIKAWAFLVKNLLCSIINN